MPRPGYVLEVDDKAPATLFWRGTELALEQLPPGSRVVYAPEAGIALIDPTTVIKSAIDEPSGAESLRSKLTSATRLTVVFDDNAKPLLSTGATDGRATAIETVLDIAADAGVDDVVLLAARGLNRRMTEQELRQVLGERVYDSFAPKGWLTQHDAENTDLLSDGFNKRVAESDLVVYVSLAVTLSDCGWTKFATGLADRRVEDAVQAAESFKSKIFAIGITADTSQLPASLTFLTRREREWRIRDKVRSTVATSLSNTAPARVVRQALRRADAPRVVTGVFAGSMDEVAKLTTDKVREQSTTQITGQSDVLAFGVPSYFPSGANETQDPISAAYSALGFIANLCDGQRVVRNGGAVIIHHPMRPEFHTARRPSYIDFFNEGLQNLDEHRDHLANDSWLTHLYSDSYAEHPLAPVEKWTSVQATARDLSAVIVVGGHTPTVKKLGFKSASTFQDALEMSADATGNAQPSVTQLHLPPVFSVDVR